VNCRDCVGRISTSIARGMDGTGTVRVLRVGRQPQVVAHFSLQPAQEDVWFAVSPDGSRVLAGILTFPALGPSIPGTGWNTLIGPTKFDLESASAGGQTKTLIHLEAPRVLMARRQHFRWRGRQLGRDAPCVPHIAERLARWTAIRDR